MQAIYVRQSVDKKDSISIETQIEECKKKINITEDYEIFSDKGFSGKSVDNRPEFQRMMEEVKKNNVSRIVVYKYDRISRSMRDFINMQSEFEKYNTALVSVNENFDTSTSQGKAMVNILMTFAEMERETIQQRVIDNYYSRGEKGLYLGGYAPFGYDKIDIIVNGKKTCTFEENQEESSVLKQMYLDYIDGKSLGEIARQLNKDNVPTRKSKPWSATSVGRMLRSPVYVKANADVYNYLKSLGAHMNNPIEDYTGKYACSVYGKVADRTSSKFAKLHSDYVTIAMHEGFIDASTWLNVQHIFQQKKYHSNIGTGSLTWLQGLVQCKCGYTMYVKRCKSRNKSKEYRYLYCRGRKNNACPYPKIMINVKVIEEIIEKELLAKLESLKDVQQNDIVKDSPEINALKIKLLSIEEKIQNIVEQFSEGNDITVKYLNQHLEKLDSEKQTLSEEIARLELKANKSQFNLNIDDILYNWKDYSISVKRKIAKEVIEKIIIEGNDISLIFY